MTDSTIKSFFIAFPKMDKAYRTYDGVIHHTEIAANKWVSRHGNKKVVEIENPFLVTEDPIEAAQKIKNGYKKQLLGALTGLHIPYVEHDIDEAIEAAESCFLNGIETEVLIKGSESAQMKET
jgi:hypothetical protein